MGKQGRDIDDSIKRFSIQLPYVSSFIMQLWQVPLHYVAIPSTIDLWRLVAKIPTCGWGFSPGLD